MNNKILKLLDLHRREYEEMYFGKYLRWCESLSHDDPTLQQALANSAINAYHRVEYTKCEAEFLKLTGRYEGSPTVTLTEIKRLYDRCTADMFNRYPKPLLERARKLRIINEPNEPTAN